MNANVQTLESPSMGRVWAVSWRILVVGFGAWFSAEFINDAVKAGGNTRINLATTGLAVGSLVAFFADFVDLFRGCKNYVRGQTASIAELSSAFWKSWAALTLIFLSLFAWASTSSRPDPWMIVYSNQGSTGPVTERRISTVPALFRRDATVDWKEGVAFNADELDVSITAFDRILSAYDACGSAAGKRQVEMTIAGYASSQAFEDVTTETSNLLNVETANRRAWNAYCYTASSVPVEFTNRSDWSDSKKWSCPNEKPVPAGAAAPIKVRVWQWPHSQAGFSDMMNSRPIQDWPEGITKEQRKLSEELNRRVDFYLNHAGACQVVTAASPAIVAANTPAPVHQP